MLVAGARPNFMKIAPLIKVIEKLNSTHKRLAWKLVHTGQHYDSAMSKVFFDDLEIPEPHIHLGIGSGTHAVQTAKTMMAFEDICLSEAPDIVVVVGDVNSTIACSMVAAKMRIKIAHVEAGLRSYDRTMPEEINRVLTDHMSSLLFCPTQTAVDNLAKEGITKGVYLVGDVMVDALEYNRGIAEGKSGIIETLGLQNRDYLVLTVHRPSNTDSRKNMVNITTALGESGRTTVFPVHPRTRKYLEEYGIWDNLPPNIIATEPLGYLDMLRLMGHAQKILTDSGGMQKEAYILGVPCITLRDTTEWPETLGDGWNVLVGADRKEILSHITAPGLKDSRKDHFGRDTCGKIITCLRKE